MNLQLLEQVRSYVAEMPRFTMEDWRRCIAGACNRIMWAERFETLTMDFDWDAQSENAREALGLTHERAKLLFSPQLWPRDAQKLGERQGALYLLDGLILAAQLGASAPDQFQERERVTT